MVVGHSDARYDVLVIGGGMAGLSLGWELTRDGHRVGVVEAERELGFHTTGRSAAAWIGGYGPEPVRALTAASHGFLTDPPPEVTTDPLTSPLGTVTVAGPGQSDLVRRHLEDIAALTEAELLGADQAVALCPILRPEWVESAVHEPGTLNIDVAGLHQGYRGALRRAGGEIHTRAPVHRAERVGQAWRVEAGDLVLEATVVVNAAGAWADEIAAAFGVTGVGIEPRRRSVFTTGAEQLPEIPMLISVDETWYVKPEAGNLLCSPAEATPQPPSNARADELEIARAIEDINTATTAGIRSVRTSWAGLRSFVPDGLPVFGPDPDTEGFFWFVGQGGFGIQMAPAAARFGAAALTGAEMPAEIAATGFEAAQVAPRR